MTDVNLDAAVTLKDLVLAAAHVLEQAEVYFGHGTDNALDEAAYLVSYSLHVSPDFPEADLQRRVTEEQRQAVAALLQRRINERLPAPYLTHEAWFAGHKFYVDERVLVPRSPIAELIGDEFTPWVDATQLHQVLDLCTGGGCIAIATALALPHVHVDAADLSEAALEVAQQNVLDHKLADRVTLIKSDLFSALVGKKYDLILSNPPYVDAPDMAALPREYRHEPELGLTAGNDGLDLVIPMLRDASAHLNVGGIIIVEVGNSAEALVELFPEVPFTWLEFEFGGHGVFLLEAQQISDYHEVFSKEAKHRHDLS